MSQGAQKLVLVLAVALAAPIALVVESGLRALIFPPDFELVRAFLEPVLTPLAWLLVAISTLAGIVGAIAQPRLVQRRLAKLPPEAPAMLRDAARNQVFFLTTSIPQIPTIASTFAFMFGASIVPTCVGVAICTLSVIAQGIALRTPAGTSTREGA